MIGYLLVLFVVLASLFLPFVSALELKLLDQEFALLRSYIPDSTDEDVVLIGIDDETTAKFPEPIALWHRHLGDLFTALSIARPSVVGVDMTLPDRSYGFIDRGLDRSLLMGLKQLSSVSPLVLGMTVNADRETRAIYPPFISAAGQHSTGYVLWKTDRDQIVRRFSEELSEHGETVPTLVGEMARHLHLEVESGLINYAVGASIQYIPMHEVVSWAQAHEHEKLTRTFANKVVFIGSVFPFVDRHLQVVNLAAWERNRRFAPGILLHVQALRNLQHGGLIQPVHVPWVMLMTLLLTLLWWIPLSKRVAISTTSILVIALPAISMWMLSIGFYLPAVTFMLTAVVAVMGRQAHKILLHEIERRRLRSAFHGVVSPQVMVQILDGNLPQGIRCRTCVLFADIRSFTTRSEKMDPEEVVILLNRYFEQMTLAIHGHSGTLDKFIGDGIMAFFGAPNRLDNPSLHAFHAAIEMLDRLESLNIELEREGTEPIRIGIGLHVGTVVIGQLGSRSRSEYTAIGDTVNTAARIEGLTKEMQMPLIFSEVVNADIGDEVSKKFALVSLGEMPIRGRSSLHLYGCAGRQDGT